MGFIIAGVMWSDFDTRMKDMHATAGTSAFMVLDGTKYMALSVIIGMGSWLPALTLGDSTDKLIGFFDNYNPKTEGSVDGTVDSDGTSL